MSVRDFPTRLGDIQNDPAALERWLDQLGRRQNIDDQILKAAPVSADEVLLFSVADNAVRKATVGTIGGFTFGAPVATPSGTTQDVTSIPSGTTIIVILLTGMSFNAVNQLRIQIGDAGGIETSGYAGIQHFAAVATGSAIAFGGSGFDGPTGYAAADSYEGNIWLFRENSSSNTWICDARLNTRGTNVNIIGISGSKSLSQELDRFRITTAAGATFDAGEFNYFYK